MNASEARRALADACMSNHIPAAYWILTGEDLPIEAPTAEPDSRLTVGVKRARELLRRLEEGELKQVLSIREERFQEIWTALKGTKP